MKEAERLRALSFILDCVADDAKEWSSKGRPYGKGVTERPGATKEGIRRKIDTIRQMLLQIRKDLDD